MEEYHTVEEVNEWQHSLISMTRWKDANYDISSIYAIFDVNIYGVNTMPWSWPTMMSSCLLTLAGQDRRLLMTLLLDYYHPECLKPGANKCSWLRCGTKPAHVADVNVPFLLTYMV